MLYVKDGIINSVSLTLKENTTISPVYYLFEFQNDFTKDKVYKLPTQVSSNSRYTEFVIDLTEDTGFDLLPTGWWSYKVYQQTSDTNLDPTLTQGLIEKGKLLVDEGDVKEVETIKYVSDNETNENYVFVDLESAFERKIWGQTHITFGDAHWVWSQSE